MKFNHFLVYPILCFVSLFFVMPMSNAQVKIDSNQDVGVGTDITDNSKLNVVNEENLYSLKLINNYSGGGVKRGIYNQIDSMGSGAVYAFRNRVFQSANSNGNSGAGVRGVFNEVFNSSSTPTYGVFNNIGTEGNSDKHGIYNRVYSSGTGTLVGIRNLIKPTATSTGDIFGSLNWIDASGTGTRFGVYSHINGASGYSGYFVGNMKVIGNLEVTGIINGTVSDVKLKKDIKKLDNALKLITNLNPSTYHFLEDNDLCLPKGKQYGLIAQELEKVLPDLVKEMKHNKTDASTISEDEAGNPIINIVEPQVETYKTVNYQALIPILIGAIKEQQTQIDKLSKMVEELKK